MVYGANMIVSTRTTGASSSSSMLYGSGMGGEMIWKTLDGELIRGLLYFATKDLFFRNAIQLIVQTILPGPSFQFNHSNVYSSHNQTPTSEGAKQKSKNRISNSDQAASEDTRLNLIWNIFIQKQILHLKALGFFACCTRKTAQQHKLQIIKFLKSHDESESEDDDTDNDDNDDDELYECADGPFQNGDGTDKSMVMGLYNDGDEDDNDPICIDVSSLHLRIERRSDFHQCVEYQYTYYPTLGIGTGIRLEGIQTFEDTINQPNANGELQSIASKLYSLALREINWLVGYDQYIKLSTNPQLVLETAIQPPDENDVDAKLALVPGHPRFNNPNILGGGGSGGGITIPSMPSQTDSTRHGLDGKTIEQASKSITTITMPSYGMRSMQEIEREEQRNDQRQMIQDYLETGANKYWNDVMNELPVGKKVAKQTLPAQPQEIFPWIDERRQMTFFSLGIPQSILRNYAICTKANGSKRNSTGTNKAVGGTTGGIDNEGRVQFDRAMTALRQQLQNNSQRLIDMGTKWERVSIAFLINQEHNEYRRENKGKRYLNKKAEPDDLKCRITLPILCDYNIILQNWTNGTIKYEAFQECLHETFNVAYEDMNDTCLLDLKQLNGIQDPKVEGAGSGDKKKTSSSSTTSSKKKKKKQKTS